MKREGGVGACAIVRGLDVSVLRVRGKIRRKKNEGITQDMYFPQREVEENDFEC